MLTLLFFIISQFHFKEYGRPHQVLEVSRDPLRCFNDELWPPPVCEMRGEQTPFPTCSKVLNRQAISRLLEVQNENESR